MLVVIYDPGRLLERIHDGLVSLIQDQLRTAQSGM